MEGGGDSAYREPGTRRRKLAGYLKAANELRQTYQAAYTQGRDDQDDPDDGTMPGSFVDGTVVRNGDEEMLLFPSYALRHTPAKKEERHERPGTGDNQDHVGTSGGGSGNAEYWKREWDRYEDDNAIVDVDIRGWIYAPQRGQMTRKNRILVGMARRLSGIPAPSPSRGTSPNSLRPRASRQEDEVAEKEAQKLASRGQGEAEVAVHGGYSGGEAKNRSNGGESPSTSREASPRPGRQPMRQASNASLERVQQRASWTQPSDMSPDELAVANSHLMMRLRPFLTTPLVSTPLTVFFYNEDTSKSRTITTNESGHFSYRAPLDFLPTHVRVLASDKLSATEEVQITEPTGVTVISDIDDTIKHSAISAGAREIFRNAFIRELDSLTIEGVKEWYQTLADMGVKFHYVSNSPWQFYPVLTGFFQAAGLPKGSYHLKQYSGMLQGIFEPVAERKKSNLDKIIADFPQRKFILIGDSGEADLELYTDIMLANPGKILAVYIRDVTTNQSSGFFDSMNRNPLPQFRDPPRQRDRIAEQASKNPAPIERRPVLPPRPSTRTASTIATQQSSNQPAMGKLIDFDDEAPAQTINYRTTDSTTNSDSSSATKSPPPTRPSKPLALRPTTSNQQQKQQPSSEPIPRKPAPPRPPKPARYSSNSSEHDKSSKPSDALASQTSTSRPHDTTTTNDKPTSQPPPYSSTSSSSSLSGAAAAPPPTYTAAVRNKVASAYNALPSFYASNLPSASPTTAPSAANLLTQRRKPPPPAPPAPRRGLTSSSTAGPIHPAGSSSSSTGQNANNAHVNGAGAGGGPSNPNTSTNGYPSTDPNSKPYSENLDPSTLMSKKEELWLRRWERAKGVFAERGVVLRSWRTGEDVAGECVGLVEREMRRAKREREECGKKEGEGGDISQV